MMYQEKKQQPKKAENNSFAAANHSSAQGVSLAPPALQFKKLDQEEESSLQMKKGTVSGTGTSTNNGIPNKILGKMENSFQSDFSNVNFHTNSQSATDVGALAYAQGNDVHFAPGQFKPNTQSGQELIGHELAHVVQQRQGRVQPTAQAKGMAVNDDKGLEKEADDMGKKAASSNTSVKQYKSKKISSTRTSPIQRAISLDRVFAVGKEINKAIAGIGTNTKDLYATLKSLNKNKIDIELANIWYKQCYGQSIISAINGEWGMSGVGKMIAKIYINHGRSLIQPHGDILGSFQANQARQKLQAMGVGVAKIFLENTIEKASSPAERVYIFKALAAGHPITAIYTFATAIRGKSKKWMQNNLRLTRDTSNQGLRQSWNDSCGPTTVQAIQGELDPIYALSVRSQTTGAINSTNGSITGTNGAPTTDQQTMLQNNGGVAVPRGGTGGQGMGFSGVLSLIKSRTGIDYEMLGASPKNSSMTKIDNVLKQGLPVPIRVGGASGGHFVLITNKSGSSYNIHDVWDGSSYTRTKANFTKNTMNIAGWPNFTHYGKPKK
jgi:hypothetical protein